MPLHGLVAHQRHMACQPSYLPPDIVLRLQGELSEFLATTNQAGRAVPFAVAAYVEVQWEQRVRRLGLPAESIRLGEPTANQIHLLLSTTLACVVQARADDDPNWPDCLFDWVIEQLVRQQAPT